MNADLELQIEQDALIVVRKKQMCVLLVKCERISEMCAKLHKHMWNICKHMCVVCSYSRFVEVSGCHARDMSSLGAMGPGPGTCLRFGACACWLMSCGVCVFYMNKSLK